MTVATRDDFSAALKKVVSGARLNSYTYDTIKTGGMCAQFSRQTVEDTLGIKAGTWTVATMALDYMRKAGRTVRWATDYEKAAQYLGYAYPANTKPQTGDIGYWPYRERRTGNDYGHTAIFYGYIDGVGYWLENTDARSRPNGRKIYEGGQVWLTPDTVLGIPRTLARPQAQAFPSAATKPPEKPKQVVDTPKEIEGHDGKRLFLIDASGESKELGQVAKISTVGDKLYVKTQKK